MKTGIRARTNLALGLHAKGVSVDEIARASGLSPVAVRRVLRDHAPDDRAELLAAHDRRASIEALRGSLVAKLRETCADNEVARVLRLTDAQARAHGLAVDAHEAA